MSTEKKVTTYTYQESSSYQQTSVTKTVGNKSYTETYQANSKYQEVNGNSKYQFNEQTSNTGYGFDGDKTAVSSLKNSVV